MCDAQLDRNTYAYEGKRIVARLHNSIDKCSSSSRLNLVYSFAGVVLHAARDTISGFDKNSTDNTACLLTQCAAILRGLRPTGTGGFGRSI